MAKRSPLAEKLDEVKTRIAEAATQGQARAGRGDARGGDQICRPGAGPRDTAAWAWPSSAKAACRCLPSAPARSTSFISAGMQHGDAVRADEDQLAHDRPPAAQQGEADPADGEPDPQRRQPSACRGTGRAGCEAGPQVPVLLQVNASEEAQKYGVAVGAAVHLAEQIDSMPGLQFTGLMTMAPLEEPEAKLRQAFARTREIFEELRWHKIGGANLRHLSMGMSHDFELAIAEGATMVRIGSLLFGGKAHDHEEMRRVVVALTAAVPGDALQGFTVPRIDFFNFFRWMLSIVATVYATVITLQSLWGWYVWLAGNDRYISLVRRYVMVHGLRLRFRAFWGDVIVCVLLCVAFLIMWHSHHLIYDLGARLNACQRCHKALK